MVLSPEFESDGVPNLSGDVGWAVAKRTTIPYQDLVVSWCRRGRGRCRGREAAIGDVYPGYAAEVAVALPELPVALAAAWNAAS